MPNLYKNTTTKVIFASDDAQTDEAVVAITSDDVAALLADGYTEDASAIAPLTPSESVAATDASTNSSASTPVASDTSTSSAATDPATDVTSATVVPTVTTDESTGEALTSSQSSAIATGAADDVAVVATPGTAEQQAAEQHAQVTAVNAASADAATTDESTDTVEIPVEQHEEAGNLFAKAEAKLDEIESDMVADVKLIIASIKARLKL